MGMLRKQEMLGCRGCGGLPLESPRAYSATDTGDLHAAACKLRRLYPDAPLLLAGFSIGAMLVTKYLADLERGEYSDAGAVPTYTLQALHGLLPPLCVLGTGHLCRHSSWLTLAYLPLQPVC